MTQKNILLVPALLPAAFDRAEDILGPGRVWQGAGAGKRRQELWLGEEYPTWRGLAGGLPEMRTFVDFSHEPLNKILTDEGFPETQLEPFSTPESFGVVAIFRLLMAWAIKGTATTLNDVHGDPYPAAKVNIGTIEGSDMLNVQFHRVHGHNNPVATLITGAGDRVHMTVLKGGYDEHSFREQLRELATQEKEELYDFGGIVFPMIDENAKLDLSWLLKMETITSSGQRAWVEQALGQVKVGLDHEGMRVEAAAAVETAFESCPVVLDPLIINDDVAVWVERPGAPDFLSASHFPDRSVWKQPASTQKSTAAPEAIETTAYEVQGAELATREANDTPLLCSGDGPPNADDEGTQEIFID